MEIHGSQQLWTIRKILKWTKESFASKGILTPRLDAEVLLSKAIENDRVYLYLNMDRPLSRLERKRMREFVRRRLNYEPVAYIIGEKEFYSIALSILKGVLIPRPETESLIEISKQLIADLNYQDLFILDLCSGSGNIGISIKSLFPDSIVLMADKDEVAIKNSVINLKRTEKDDIGVIKADIKMMPFRAESKFSLIISNPPYISAYDMDLLSPQIRLYEKPQALYGGVDGCSFIPFLFSIAETNLITGGFMVLEFPYKQFDNALENLKRFTYLEFYDKITDYGNNIQGFIVRKRD